MSEIKKKRCRSLTPLAATVALALAMASADINAVPLSIERSNLSADEWLTRDSGIEIQLNRLPNAEDGRLRFFAGKRDITTLFQSIAPGHYRYQGKRVRLPSGEQNLTIYRVHPDRGWLEIGSLPLRVLSSGGFEEAEFQPRVDIGSQSQLDEKVEGDAFPSGDGDDAGLNTSAGFTGRHVRNGWTLDSSASFVGASRREEALRFGEQGVDAPKFDLSDYRVSLNDDSLALSLGHVSFGNNRLLVSDVANRGFTLNKAFGNRFDLSLSSQNGSSVTGYNNLLGHGERKHNIAGVSLGTELIGQRPGALRVELSYLRASILPESDFDSGEVVDAEESHGFGLRIIGSTPSGRLRGELLAASSSYTNPEDPLLAQGEALVAVKRERSKARAAELAYDLLRDAQLTRDRSLSLTLSARHERIDPLYKSVGAFPTPDLISNHLDLDLLFGELALQLKYQRGEDNLDDIDTILKTRTVNRLASLSLPLNTTFGTEASAILPTLSYNYARVHQYGVNRPPEFTDASHIPDQISRSHNLDLNWGFTRWGLAYAFAIADQDNRQAGRDQADSRTTQHSLNLTLTPFEALDLNLGLGRTEQENKEIGKINRADSQSFGFAWRITDRLGLNSNMSRTRESDSLGLASGDNHNLALQLNWRYYLPFGGGRKLPGELFLRYAMDDSEREEREFDLASDAATTTVVGGINLSLL
ncbi:MAG: hypothetical protein ABW092_21305 [Candidatus Thiodiazotropha sp.]